MLSRGVRRANFLKTGVLARAQSDERGFKSLAETGQSITAVWFKHCRLLTHNRSQTAAVCRDFVVHSSDSSTNEAIDFFGCRVLKHPSVSRSTNKEKKHLIDTRRGLGIDCPTDASLAVAVPSAPPGSTRPLPTPSTNLTDPFHPEGTVRK